MSEVLVTGGTGFVGNHVVTRLRADTGWRIHILTRSQKLLPQGEDVSFSRVYHDIRAPFLERDVQRLQNVRYVIHAAAEVSGERSLLNPVEAVTTSALGTYHVLELARRLPRLERLVYVSTGEVLGSTSGEPLAEDAPLRPVTPYAAGKAAAEELCRAYHLGYKVPVVIVRSMNLFGPYQSVGRFVPMVIKNILNGEEITCHANGSRNWLHVEEFTRALWNVISGKVGETYHVVGSEKSNASIIYLVASVLGKRAKIRLEESGARYALNDTKLGSDYRLLGSDLCQVVFWYANNPGWLA